MLRSLFTKPTELKTPRELALMRESGKVVAKALRLCREMAKPGVKTIEIDQAVEALYASHGATPLFKGYEGGAKVPFPAVTCLSINDQVVHGIPGQRKLKDGDLFKIDTACKLNGWRADAAVTLVIGTVRPEWLRLLKVALEVLEIARVEMPKRKWWSEVAFRMQQHAEGAGFSVVQQFVGHGIGRIMHESPQVHNFFGSWLCPRCRVTYHLPTKAPKTPGFCDRCSRQLAPHTDRESRKLDFRLDEGLALAIEPMVNMGKPQVETSGSDYWTVTTRDGMPSVHVEHTFALTREGVLTLTADDGLENASVVNAPA